MKFQMPVAQKLSFLTVLLAVFVNMNACKTDEPYPELNLEIAGPIDVVERGGIFYVLNSDFDRRFLNGSILAIDPAASGDDRKKFSVKVPRLGRSLFVRDNLLLATFTAEEVSEASEVQLRTFKEDEAAGASLPLTVSWKVECSPINGVISPAKRYVVVSCVGGDIWAGRIDVEKSEMGTLQKVRSYQYTRRALHIHQTKSGEEILFALPTDVGQQESTDFLSKDEKSYTSESVVNDNGSIELSEGANEVPDQFEKDLIQLGRQQLRSAYQMVILNLTQAEKDGFPYIDLGTPLNPTKANKEVKFIYYDLKGRRKDSDDLNLYDIEPQSGKKHYHTNFWTTQPLSDNASGFYVSQRGRSNEEKSTGEGEDETTAAYANNIIKVEFLDESLLSDPENFPETSQMLSFTRVFGTNLDLKRSRLEDIEFPYPGAFEVIQGQSNVDILIVNDFRDVLWPASSQLFSIYSTILGDSPDPNTATRKNGGIDDSYFQVATSSDGYLASCSYYGNSVTIMSIDLKTGKLNDNVTKI